MPDIWLILANKKKIHWKQWRMKTNCQQGVLIYNSRRKYAVINMIEECVESQKKQKLQTIRSPQIIISKDIQIYILVIHCQWFLKGETQCWEVCFGQYSPIKWGQTLPSLVWRGRRIIPTNQEHILGNKN